MPYTPYNPHTNPSIYYGNMPPATIPKPPGYSGGWPPAGPGSGGGQAARYNVPPTTEFSPGANPPRPPSPLYPPGYKAPGGAPAGDYWNGYKIIQHGPGGNILVDWNGQPKAFDAWGNEIAHLGVGYTSADPNAGPSPQGPAAPVPDPTAPGLPTPPSQVPTTFYSPTNGSQYLQFGNFLSYLNDQQRSQLNDTLTGAGFRSTGAMSTYGNADYIRPPQFDEQDLAGLNTSDNMRQWLRWYLGNLGYGQSYQLPAGYQAGSGIPTPPPSP